MITPIGRIVARGNVTGLFLPFKAEGTEQLDGIYNVYEMMGQLVIKRVGDPNMDPTMFKGKDLHGLMDMRPSSVMTKEELEKIDSEEFKI